MAEVLRYPYDLLTEDTDYLQIDLVEKTYAGQQGKETIKRRIGAKGPAGGSVTGGKEGDILKLTRPGGFAKNTKPTNNIGNNIKLAKNFVTTSSGIIILPIPSSIADSNSVSYSEDKLDAVTAIAGGVALNAMKTDFNDKFVETLTNNVRAAVSGTTITGGDLKDIYLGNLAAQAAGIAGIGNMSIDQLLARSEGKILNPNMELLFNGPTIRSFKFSFKFTPRSEKEAEQVKLIIGSLKRHMVPQSPGSFLGTPNFFELRYRSGKGNHKFLNKFKQCVLENMSVNYTGENTYATYWDGTPVSMIMDLTFKELEPIYSTDYKNPGDQEYNDNIHGGVGY